MRGYGQYCPLAKGAEVVAERWTPLILRELLFGENTFNDIQRGVPLMSRSLLSKRLKELERAGVIDRRQGRRGPEYHLSAAGRDLEGLLVELANWGTRWTASNLRREELDPRPLIWDMRRRIHLNRMPERRVVVQFKFSDVPRPPLRTAWLVWDGKEVDVCYRDPGFEVDLLVSTSLQILVDAWIGDIPLMKAIDDHLITIEGPSELVAGLPKWLALSIVAPIDRPAQRRTLADLKQ